MYFPDRENESGDYKEDIIRQILILKLELTEEYNKETEERIVELCKQYRQLSKPLIFWPNSKKNTWVKFKKHFEKMYAVLEESGIKEPKNLTVFEFYTRLEHLQQRNENAAKQK